MNDLARYLSPEDRGHPVALSFDSAEQEVSILLADVKGFTNFSEGRPPAEIVRVLNDYFALVIEEIFGHGGTIDKFIGDCVMGVFGAPVPKVDHALRAVRAAWAIRARVERFNEERRLKGVPVVRVGCAINSGRVVSGHIGSDQRRDFTVIGDSVNLAARIEDFVTSDQVLIGQRTFADVKDHVRVHKLPPHRVKGINEVVQIYEIQELTDIPSNAANSEGLRNNSGITNHKKRKEDTKGAKK